MKKIVLSMLAISGLLLEPGTGFSKRNPNFFYLILPCPEDSAIYIDGRRLTAPYKVKLYVGVSRTMEIRTSEGEVYIGSIEPIAKGTIAGKSFGYYTCITNKLLHEFDTGSSIVVKSEKGKDVAKITLKKASKPAH